MVAGGWMVDHHGGFSFDPEPVFVTGQPKATQRRKESQLTTLTTVSSDSLQIWEAVKLYWKESSLAVGFELLD